jgi:hypothetical protein
MRVVSGSEANEITTIREKKCSFYSYGQFCSLGVETMRIMFLQGEHFCARVMVNANVHRHSERFLPTAVTPEAYLLATTKLDKQAMGSSHRHLERPLQSHHYAIYLQHEAR